MLLRVVEFLYTTLTMSSEFFHSGSSEQQFDEMSIRADIFYAKNSVTDTLDDLAAYAYNYQGYDAIQCDIATEVRTKQLKVLSSVVFAMALKNDRGVALDLDELYLLEKNAIPEAEYLAEVGINLETIIDENERLGTNDFLSILAQTEVTNQTTRDIYYHPWTRGVVEATLLRDLSDFNAIGSLDGTLYFTRPTRIPNIEVIFSYVPNEQIPQRILRVKRGNDSAG